MIKFHPDQNLLTEYSAGSLDWGLAIAVKTHLSMCSECSQNVARLNTIGSAFFSHAAETTVPLNHEDNSFKALMRHIESHDVSELNTLSSIDKTATLTPAEKKLPSTIQCLLPVSGKLRWRSLTRSLKQANLKTNQDKYEICLHKIRRGGKVVSHDHRGKEVTVVLEGTFSDENGTYIAGDFIERNPGDCHRPTATQDQDCLCLSLVEAPVKLTGLLGLFINPFLPFKPA